MNELPKTAVFGFVALILLLPLLAIVAVSGGGSTGTLLDACLSPSDVALGVPADNGGDGTPTILGPPQLTATQMIDGYGRSGYRLTTDEVTGLVALYAQIGQAEGVRADWAFAQGIVETAGFTSDSWRLEHNPAGIAHYDGQAHGTYFGSDQDGITAQIQLLKRYAAGNAVVLALPDLAPQAGARATTWGQLTGRWATSPRYRTAVVGVHDRLAGAVEGARPGSPHVALVSSAIDCSAALGSESGTEVRTCPIQSALTNCEVVGTLTAMVEAAHTDGVQLVVGNSYRSTAQQIDLRLSHCGSSHYAIYEAAASTCHPPTARPGTSMHERGLAVDWADCNSRSTACFTWLSVHAKDFGFFNLPSEPWHWSVNGN